MSSRVTTRRRQPQTVREGFFGKLLDPIDRLAEAIYSILILLTFTLAYRVATVNEPAAQIPREYVNDLLLAAVSAILAWGLIDGVMHILLELFQRGERHRMLRQIQTAPDEQAAIAIIADELDYVLEPISGAEERATLYHNVFAELRDSAPRPIGFKREDFAGALGCVVVALGAVIPSLIPFVLLGHDPNLAIRLSNLVSFVVLFLAGYRWGIYTGASPWRTGTLLAAVGVLMVAIAIPLGG